MRDWRRIGLALWLASAVAVTAQTTVDLDLVNGDLRVLGNGTNANVGYSLASCDIDGDGLDDMVIGSPGASPSGRAAAGIVYVLLGDASLSGAADLAAGAADIEVHGRAAGERLGHRVACGDTDGDGYGDLLAGAPQADPFGRTDAGSVYLVRGAATPTSLIDLAATAADVEFYGRTSGDNLGSGLATGDIDSSGVDDNLLGATRADGDATDTGRVLVFFDGPLPATIDLVSVIPDLQVWGVAFADQLGAAIATGDVDGDGDHDLILSAPSADPDGRTSAGAAYVVYGGTGLSGVLRLSSPGSQAITIEGAATADLTGSDVAAGDVNADGYDDILIGAYAADPGGRTNAGRVYVIYGGGSLGSYLTLPADSDVQIEGESSADGIGWSVEALNVNGDGFADILIGGPIAIVGGGSNSGRALLVEGDPALPSSIDLSVTSPRLTVLSDDVGDLLGFSVSAGDLNGDGVEDLLIGAAGADPAGSNAGEAYVLYGEPPYVGFSVPDTTVTYRQSLQAAVRVDTTTGFKLAFAAIDLLFADSLLTFDGVTTAGTLTDGWTVDAQVIDGGADLDTLRILATTNGAAASTTGTLFLAGFTVADVRRPSSSPLIVERLQTNATRDEWITATDGSARLVGVDARLTATVVAEPGDTLRVRVVDVDGNRNDAVAEQIPALLVNLRTGEQESVLLTETSVDDSVFFATLATTAGSAAGADDDGEMAATDDDSLQVAFLDSLDATGASTTRVDTSFVLQPLGDADDNDVTQAFDAARILAHATGLLSLTGRDSLAANVDEDAPFGPINAYDASLAIQLRLGLLDRLPVRLPTSANHPQPQTQAAARPLPAAQPLALRPAEGGGIALYAPERAGLVSGDLRIDGWDADVVARPAPDLVDGMALVRREADGALRVAFAAAGAPAGPGELLRLLPAAEAAPPVADLTLSGRLNGGLEVRQTADTVEPTALPRQWRLHPAHPNPFNAETVVPFTLPETGRVRLEVYNGLGQRVRSLLDEVRPAGRHRLTWDGRFDDGSTAASGPYTLVLTTPAGLRLTQRALLLK
jgi:hypothetical protein